MAVPIGDIERLLGAFRALEAQTAHARLTAFENHFARLGAGVAAFERAKAQRHRRDPAFNIFRLLGLEHYEVTTHSTLLADLLNPDGSHGQGGLFLRGFLHRLGYPEIAARVSDDPARRHEWWVAREVEHVDIRVASHTHGFLAFIENKVHAGEQKDQMKTHHARLEGYKRTYATRCLAFLTLDRHPPNTGRADCCLSYRKDIVAWIEEALPSVEAPTLRAVLEQYLETIANL